jgi:hypothetical protein
MEASVNPGESLQLPLKNVSSDKDIRFVLDPPPIEIGASVTKSAFAD